MNTFKKKKTFFNILEMIVDIIVYPVIIISFLSSFFMLVAKSKNVISPIFGHSFVRVLSGSMSKYCPEANRNFLKGDIAMIRANLPKYEVGDVIAFYNYNDSADNLKLFDLTSYESSSVPELDKDGHEVKDDKGNVKYVTNRYAPVKDKNGNIVYNNSLYNSIVNTNVGGQFYDEQTAQTYTKVAPPKNRKTLKDVQNTNTQVNFHQVVQIKIDTSGTIFYVTKGTANAEKDSFEIRQDFVAGKYVNTPKWISSVINFCASTEGMIILVVAPISFIVLIELLSILEQINNILLEKKVVNREIPFDTKDCIKANIGYEMRDADKVYYYDVMPPDYKEDVFEFLWGCLKYSKNKKDIKVYDTAVVALSVYDMENPNLYYMAWSEMFKSKRSQMAIQNAQERSLKEKYADVLYVDYQNTKPEVIDEVAEQDENENNQPNKPIDVNAKLKEIDEKLAMVNDKSNTEKDDKTEKSKEQPKEQPTKTTKSTKKAPSTKLPPKPKQKQTKLQDKNEAEKLSKKLPPKPKHTKSQDKTVDKTTKKQTSKK